MSRAAFRNAFFVLLLMFASADADAVAAARPRPGDTPPDVLGVDGDGKPQTVSQHRGKVVIVTFWASWCGPCRRELPMLARVRRTIGSDHIEVIAVNANEPRADYLAVVRRNRREFELTYVHDKGKVADAYGVTSLPNMFIIGPDGVIAHTHVGYGGEMIERFIAEIVALLPPDVLARPAGT